MRLPRVSPLMGDSASAHSLSSPLLCHYSHRGLHIVHKKLSLAFLVLISFPRGITQILTLIIIAFKFLISSPRFSSYHHLYAFTLWIHHPYPFFCLYPLSISVIPRSIIIITLLHPSSSWPLPLHLGSDQHYTDYKPSAYLQPHPWPLSCSHKWIIVIPSTAVLDPVHSHLLTDFSPEIIKLFPLP